MDILSHLAIGLLSLLIALVSNFGARLLPRQSAAPSAPSQTSPAPALPADPSVQYASLQSAALGKDLKFAIQLPPSYEHDTSRRYPVLYFLHGMFGNEGEFQRRGVAAAVRKLRDQGAIGDFIIVAPAGENSFYLNAKNGVRYEDAIIKDLIPYVEKTYRAIGTRDGRAVQGISMGGWGALMLAFKHPEMFSTVTTHSAALFTDLPQPTGTDRRSVFMLRLIGNIFGSPPDEEFFKSVNPVFIAEANAAAIKKSGIKVYFDCGDKDRYGFQDSNTQFDEKLTKLGIAHEFHLYPGNHGWEYMISVADHSYTFLWKNFKTDSKAAAPVRSRASRFE
ncbi:MAG TPA: alpha/beta hydrolase-fold protein [Blastocatellia bacterium]|nr:alpha/beta hydrolase-fold protein [Blastocatellia bacterium]